MLTATAQGDLFNDVMTDTLEMLTDPTTETPVPPATSLKMAYFDLRPANGDTT